MSISIRRSSFYNILLTKSHDSIGLTNSFETLPGQLFLYISIESIIFQKYVSQLNVVILNLYGNISDLQCSQGHLEG